MQSVWGQGKWDSLRCGIVRGLQGKLNRTWLKNMIVQNWSSSPGLHLIIFVQTKLCKLTQVVKIYSVYTK